MNDVSLREFIERIIVENNLRRDDLRAMDNRRHEEAIKALEQKFDASVEDVDKARVIQDKEYERRLEAYPALKDFNELKTSVEVELATRVGSFRGLILFFTISSGLSILISMTVAVLTFGAPK